MSGERAFSYNGLMGLQDGQTSTTAVMMETLLRCKKFTVIRKQITGSDGNQHDREIVLHPGAVVVLPVLDDGRIVMVDQFRPAIDRRLLELPAGTLDVEGEAVECCAERELEEETGYQAKRLELLCEFYPSPGILTEKMHVFVARDLTMTQAHPEPTEEIEVVTLTLEDALARMRDGRIVDGKTMIALMLHKLRSEMKA